MNHPARLVTGLCSPALPILALLLVLGGCATRPVNPPITQADPSTGYRFEMRQAQVKNKDNLVILAFSGGGTRAAAFSYGVLEFLRRTEIVGPNGDRGRLLDEVDVITGVSGGSFTALAYGLYGDKLFDEYEQRFLKRNVQGEIIARAFSPAYWGKLTSTGWGRSELAAQLYDEILFNGATFGDLDRGTGPLILASATDISTGSRFVFNQRTFDVICSDLNAVPLSRAAAASSAVPVVLSAITIKNYGGTCNATPPAWAKPFLDSANPPRPAARAIRSLKAEQAYRRQRAVGPTSIWSTAACRTTSACAACSIRWKSSRRCTKRACQRRSTAPAGSSSSSSIRCPRRRPTGTSRRPRPARWTSCSSRQARRSTRSRTRPIELLRDTAARWQTMRLIRNSAAFAANKDPAVAAALRVPDAEIYAIDVSFPALKDKAEFDYLNRQPTTFVLPAEAVDRLRAAAATIIMASPEFQRLLKDVGARIVADPPRAGGAAGPAAQ